jgi:hypothetical protein
MGIKKEEEEQQAAGATNAPAQPAQPVVQTAPVETAKPAKLTLAKKGQTLLKKNPFAATVLGSGVGVAAEKFVAEPVVKMVYQKVTGKGGKKVLAAAAQTAVTNAVDEKVSDEAVAQAFGGGIGEALGKLASAFVGGVTD